MPYFQTTLAVRSWSFLSAHLDGVEYASHRFHCQFIHCSILSFVDLNVFSRNQSEITTDTLVRDLAVPTSTLIVNANPTGYRPARSLCNNVQACDICKRTKSVKKRPSDSVAEWLSRFDREVCELSKANPRIENESASLQYSLANDFASLKQGLATNSHLLITFLEYVHWLKRQFI